MSSRLSFSIDNISVFFLFIFVGFSLVVLFHFLLGTNFPPTPVYTQIHDQLMNDDDDDDCEKFCIYFLFHCHNSLGFREKKELNQTHTRRDEHKEFKHRYNYAIQRSDSVYAMQRRRRRRCYCKQ